MNTPHDNSGTDPRGDAALTPEERALAEQIARTAPQRGPSPALDASILRAARVAVAAPHPTEAAAAAAATRATSARRRTQRRRWPAVFGVAATLALAFGLAWQLRPVDEVRVMTSEAPGIPPRPEANAGGPSAEDQAAMAVQHDESSTEVAAQAVAAPEAITDTLQAKASKQSAPREQNEEAAEVKQVFAVEPAPDAGDATRTAPSAAPAAPPPPPQEPPVLMAPAPEPPSGILPAPAIAEPAPQAASDQLYRANKERRAPAPSPGAMAAPAPVSAPAASDSAASGTVAPRSGYSSNESQQRQKQESEKQAQALDRIEVTSSRVRGFEDQPIDDEPPASADSPEVREAWLKRVRELVTQGDRDAARDSLREYRRRYPDAAIPDDLRPLLSE